MDIGSLLIGLALIVLTILYIAFPFLKKDENDGSKQTPGEKKDTANQNHEKMISKLLQERDRLIKELEELEFDFRANKINREDYPVLRDSLLRSGAMIMHQLEESGYSVQGLEVSGTDKKENRKIQDANDEFEMLINHRRMARQEKTSGFCPKCGAPLQKSDKFCPKCGALLRDVESE